MKLDKTDVDTLSEKQIEEYLEQQRVEYLERDLQKEEEDNERHKELYDIETYEQNEQEAYEKMWEI